MARLAVIHTQYFLELEAFSIFFLGLFFLVCYSKPPKVGDTR